MTTIQPTQPTAAPNTHVLTLTLQEAVRRFTEIPTFKETWNHYSRSSVCEQLPIIQAFCLLYLEKYNAEPLTIKYRLHHPVSDACFLTIFYQRQQTPTYDTTDRLATAKHL